MNDIYEKKANKYKYKYLKLKKQYIAEGGANDWFSDLFKPLTDILGISDQPIPIQQQQYEQQRKKNFELQLKLDKEERERKERLRRQEQIRQHPVEGPPLEINKQFEKERQPLGIEQFKIEEERRRRRQQQQQQQQQQQLAEQEKRRRQQQQLAEQEQIRRQQQQLAEKEQQYRAQQQEQIQQEQIRQEQLRRQEPLPEQQKLQFVKKNITNIKNINYDIEFIGEGGFGCVISPPLKFNNIIYIDKNQENINDYELNKIFTSKEYVGKLLSCDNEVFNDEYKDFIELNRIDPEAKHRSNLKFAAYMSSEDLNKELKNLKVDPNELYNKIRNRQELTQLEKLYKCLSDRNKQIINSSSKNYGYIISTKVGKSLIQVLKSNNFNNDKIILFLEKLKESIGDLIKKLYTDGSIHGDIKFDNMTMTFNDKGEIDNESKICFIDFGFMQKYNILDKLKTKNHQYPYILSIFKNIKNKINNPNQKIRKLEFINLLNNKSYSSDKIEFDLQPTLLKFTNLNFMDYRCFFHSLEDNKEYSLIDYYIMCIKPIAKNVDIHSLSIYIYFLFYNFYPEIKPFNYYDNYNIKIKNILKELLINALYNNIDGPEELIIYIDAIINSIKNNINTIIYEQIEKRRKNKDIKFYYYYHDNYIDSNHRYIYK
jgi:tRNA A-37 threonylcarbamoyl transferase component Bud32